MKDKTNVLKIKAVVGTATFPVFEGSKMSETIRLLQTSAMGNLCRLK
jgi:hypothetical protein